MQRHRKSIVQQCARRNKVETAIHLRVGSASLLMIVLQQNSPVSFAYLI